MKGRGNRVRSFGHELDFFLAGKTENTDARRNFTVKYAV